MKGSWTKRLFSGCEEVLGQQAVSHRGDLRCIRLRQQHAQSGKKARHRIGHGALPVRQRLGEAACDLAHHLVGERSDLRGGVRAHDQPVVLHEHDPRLARCAARYAFSFSSMSFARR